MKISSGDKVIHEYVNLQTGKTGYEYVIVVGIKDDTVMIMSCISPNRVYKSVHIKEVIGHINSKILFSTCLKGVNIKGIEKIYQYELRE